MGFSALGDKITLSTLNIKHCDGVRGVLFAVLFQTAKGLG